MAFTIKNEASALYSDQSEIDALDWSIVTDALHGTAIFTGCGVTATGTPGKSVTVASGTYRINSSNKTCAGGNVNVLDPAGATNADGSVGVAAHATLARYDLIVVDSSNTFGVIHGSTMTPVFPDFVSNPVFPAYASNQAVVAAIYVPPTTTALVSGLISTKDVGFSVDMLYDKIHTLSGANHTGTLSVAQGLGKSQQLTGATAATNYVGATSSGAPVSGTFAIGDFVIDQTGKVYVCTTAGTPGTWTSVGNAIATDPTWAAKGDLVAATANDTAAVLTVGAALQDRLVADTAASTGLKWVPHLIRKTADETVNNSSTVQSDDDLKFTIAAAESWFFQLWIKVTSVSTASDFKAGWSVPANVTMTWGAVVASTANSPFFNQGSGTAAAALLTAAQTQNAGSDNLTYGLFYSGWAISTSGAGTVNFQWAQNTATSENTKVLQDSAMILWRLA